MREYHRYSGNHFAVGTQVLNIKSGNAGVVQSNFGYCEPGYHPKVGSVPILYDGNSRQYGVCEVQYNNLAEITL